MFLIISEVSASCGIFFFETKLPISKVSKPTFKSSLKYSIFLAVGLFGDKEKLAKGLSLLTDSSVELYSQLVEEAGQPELIKKSDYLQVYRHRSNFYKSASEISLRRKFGSQIEEMQYEFSPK